MTLQEYAKVFAEQRYQQRSRLVRELRDTTAAISAILIKNDEEGVSQDASVAVAIEGLQDQINALYNALGYYYSLPEKVAVKR